uniref:Uncharacterized protein n=1 Tax=Plectus sambesii TaxID=2011161 RepID=A0A914WZG7_9BILA
MLLLSAVLVALSVHVASAQLPTFCDQFSEAVALRCVSPLVDYVNLQSQALHPQLSNPEYLCRRYAEYKRCATEVTNSDCTSAVSASFTCAMACTSVAIRPTNAIVVTPRICLPGQFQCHDNTKCLTPGSLCDGNEQCDDGSDEKYC